MELILDEKMVDGVRRYVNDEGVKMVSVFDVIRSIGFNYPHKVYYRLCLEFPDLVNQCPKHRFHGSGQKDTPTADINTLSSIVNVLPSKCVMEYRQRMLCPTTTLVRASSRPSAKLPILTAKKTNPPEITYLYVRVRYPDNLLQKATSDKSFTMNVIKFGITSSLTRRHANYQKDNGFMLYTFVFNTKEDARVIESALAGVFSHITLFGSREYLCVKSLAEFLDVPDYDPQSYDTYLSMAKNLFRYAVRLTCTVWSKRYNNTAKRLSVDKVEEDFEIDI